MLEPPKSGGAGARSSLHKVDDFVVRVKHAVDIYDSIFNEVESRCLD